MSIIVGLFGASGHTGIPTLLEFLKNKEIDKIKVLLKKKYKRNKLVLRIAKKNKGRIEIFYGDVSNKEDVLNAIKDCHYLFNLSGVIPPLSDEEPNKSYLANEKGAYVIVDAIQNYYPDVKLIDITTVALYGQRNEKHPYIRVGDPLFPGVYDFYTTHKIRGEFHLLESDVKNFVIIRQTAMIYMEMMTSNMKKGIIFHTPFNTPVEWSTAEDTARLFASIIKEDQLGHLNHRNFWNKIFNLGGGEKSRVSGYEIVDAGFKILGGSAKDFYEPRYNVTRNFHCGFYYDGEELNNLFHYRQDTFSGYWDKIKKKYWYFSLGRICPKKLIKKFAIERVLKDEHAPEYWYKHKDYARIIAYFGSAEAYEKLPKSWDGFPLVDYQKEKTLSTYKSIDYGFDIDKKDEDISYDDLINVAKRHGGKLLTPSFKTGDIYHKVEWENSDGQRFIARPYTVLRGGHWMNITYKEYAWEFDRLAKKDALYAIYWYDSNEVDENHYYYFDEDLKAKIR